MARRESYEERPDKRQDEEQRPRYEMPPASREDQPQQMPRGSGFDPTAMYEIKGTGKVKHLAKGKTYKAPGRMAEYFEKMGYATIIGEVYKKY